MMQRSDPAPTLFGDRAFMAGMAILGGSYVVFILALLAADLFFTTPDHLLQSFQSKAIRYSIKLSVVSCTITTILALWVAIPMGYVLSRSRFPGKVVVDTILDVPLVLPPLVIGLSLLILFQTWPGRQLEDASERLLGTRITYAVPSVIVAQFAVATAFAVRTMRVTFDQISPRTEQVAMTLGCSRAQAFWRVTLPQARRGVLTAATLAWARSLGEFGPILIFAGATRMRTEVLSTTVFLELSIGNIDAAIAVAILMVMIAIVVLVLTKLFGLRDAQRSSTHRPAVVSLRSTPTMASGGR